MAGLWRMWRGEVRLGRRGERAAAQFMRRRGFRILFQNRKIGRYEADLIAFDPDGRTLVVAEVKTRRGATDQIAPQERIDRRKRLHLAAIAAQLKKDRRFERLSVRFDVVAVVFPKRGRPEIQYIPAAFDSEF